MTIKDSVKLMELYAMCPKCGCETIGNGKGTLECDTSIGYFKRTCGCGWGVEVKESAAVKGALARNLHDVATNLQRGYNKRASNQQVRESLCPNGFSNSEQSLATENQVTSDNRIESDTVKGVEFDQFKTNADHIRTMTDEELAELLYSRLNVDAEQIPFCKGGAKCETMLANEVEIPAEMCQECMLKWLQEPWKGGDT